MSSSGRSASSLPLYDWVDVRRSHEPQPPFPPPPTARNRPEMITAGSPPAAGADASAVSGRFDVAGSTPGRPRADVFTVP